MVVETVLVSACYLLNQPFLMDLHFLVNKILVKEITNSL